MKDRRRLMHMIHALDVWGRREVPLTDVRPTWQHTRNIPPRLLARMVAMRVGVLIYDYLSPVDAALGAARTLTRLLPGIDDALLITLVSRVLPAPLSPEDTVTTLGCLRLGNLDPYTDRPAITP